MKASPRFAKNNHSARALGSPQSARCFYSQEKNVSSKHMPEITMRFSEQAIDVIENISWTPDVTIRNHKFL